MKRKHMTDAKNEKLKQAQLEVLHTGICVGELMPEVEKIEIEYVEEHRSALGVINRKNKMVITSQHEAFFIIPCLNRECSSVGFNLKYEILAMLREHQTEHSCVKNCEGQEAPDHPEQSCGCSIGYTIRISYT